ncbi:MAG: hypothetical protein Q8P01_02205 [bacterium]|nr:hypothetical protein [bacterium]
MANGKVSISTKDIQSHRGVVVLPIKEYRRLCERAVPEFYLAGKAAERGDKLVEEGLKEYREGKTRKIRSLADLENDD